MARLNYPSQTAMVRNILREYRAVNDADKLVGNLWYASAYAQAVEFAFEFSYGVEQAVGVIAALSPQTQWWFNVMLAKQAMRSRGMIQGHTSDTMAKVNRILLGEEPLVVLGGKKVRSFYQNILSAGEDEGIVTVDRHAWRTVCGRHELGKRNAVPDAGYELAQSAFIRAAEIIGDGLTPAKLQAIVWVPRAS